MKTIEERFLKTSDTKVADDTALCNNALAEKEHQPVVLVNKVLPFPPLQNLEYHPYLEELGLTEAICTYFGAWCFNRRGIMHGRIVVPVHNGEEELVAHAGIWQGDPPKMQARCKFPDGFHHALEVCNLHRVQQAGKKRVVVTEDILDCMKVTQAGCLAVAIIGDELSYDQVVLLSSFTHLVIVSSNPAYIDECLRRVSRLRHVCAVEVAQDVSLCRLPDYEIIALLHY